MEQVALIGYHCLSTICVQLVHHLPGLVYLVVIDNFKISSPLVRVNKNWPNNTFSLALLSNPYLTNTKRSAELLISGNASQSLQGIAWTLLFSG